MVNKLKGEQKILRVLIPDVVRRGSYANLASVTSTGLEEVMLDFVYVHPNDSVENHPAGTLVSRVILPMNVAKNLMIILEKQLGKPKEV